MGEAIRVLLVDDSAVARMHLTQILESDPKIRVIAAVGDGQAALDFVAETLPDVILMDVQMPGLDGFEATRRIMETRPVPVIICSSISNPQEVATTFRILEAGAVACLEKPKGRAHPDFERMAEDLRRAVRLMAELKVVKRWSRAKGPAPGRRPPPEPPRLPFASPRCVGIGASTGGPPVLATILGGLGRDFPVPILVVQHIARGFLPGLMAWLGSCTDLRVEIAAPGVTALPGYVYFAPDDRHLGIDPGGRMFLADDPPEAHVRPSVSYLFRSLARSFGSGAIGVLLTGMGKDGAAELKALRELGATTIAQDRESSVVFGIPGEAIALGGAVLILPPAGIADALLSLVGPGNGKET